MGKTLVHVRHALFQFFLQEDTLDPATQSGLVQFECEDIDLKRAIVIEGLKELEKAEVCKEAKKSPTESVWVLCRPLGMYEQSVSVGYETALSLAKVINDYCEKIGNKREICDGSALKERDLQKLILIFESATKTNSI